MATLLVNKTEYAKQHGVSGAQVSHWTARGWIVMAGKLVDAEASDAMLAAHRDAARDRRGSKARPKQDARSSGRATTTTIGEARAAVRALDWSMRPHDWSTAAQEIRAGLAARAVNCAALRSPARDDGHWGGFQVRDLALLAVHGDAVLETIVAGHGWELDAFHVLEAVRSRIDAPYLDAADLAEPMSLTVEQVGALAYPYGEFHAPES